MEKDIKEGEGFKDWEDLNVDERVKVLGAFKNTEDRNESDKVNPREEDVKDYYEDNAEKFGFETPDIEPIGHVRVMRYCPKCSKKIERSYSMEETGDSQLGTWINEHRHCDNCGFEEVVSAGGIVDVIMCRFWELLILPWLYAKKGRVGGEETRRDTGETI